MTTALTHGIYISVNCQYEKRFSNPDRDLFMFSYQIEIENTNDFPIQLMRRHWRIVDTAMHHREVCGDGVIGEQPVIEPGGRYRYKSACDFTTDTGRMVGHYEMKNLASNHEFQVDIPAFMLMVPHRLN